MEALAPTPPLTAPLTPVPPTARADAAARVEPGRDPATPPAQAVPPGATLPALPAAVQRAQLEPPPPPPALMTREQMAALLLSLTT
jgi:hypothetical protein